MGESLEAGRGREKPLRSDGPRQLTNEEVKTLLWHSFAFSQGSPSAQKLILRFVATKYGKQSIDRGRQMEIFKLTGLGNPERAGIIPPQFVFFPGKLSSMRMHSSARGKRQDVPTMRPLMRRYLKTLNRNYPQMIAEHLPGAILLRMLITDYLYVTEGRERDRQNIVEDNLWRDPHFSFIVKHFLRSESTGIPVYDQMFAAMREYYQGGTSLKRYLTKRICMIANAYNRKHSKKITKEELLRFCGEEQASKIDEYFGGEKYRD